MEDPNEKITNPSLEMMVKCVIQESFADRTCSPLKVHPVFNIGNNRATTRPTDTSRFTTATSSCPSSDPQYCKQYSVEKNHYCQQDWVQEHCKHLCGACGKFV